MKRRFALCSSNYRLNLDIVKADVSSIPCDIILNCSNKGLSGSTNLTAYWMFAGRKNVDTSIHNLAGPQLQLDCNSIVFKNATRSNNDAGRYVKCDVGEVWITCSSGQLQSKFVAHTVSPRYYDVSDDQCLTLLYDSYSSVFLASFILQSQTICIPALGCGISEVPPPISAAAFMKALSDIAHMGTPSQPRAHREASYSSYKDGKLCFDSKSSLLIPERESQSLGSNIHPPYLKRIVCCMLESKTFWAWVKAAESSSFLKAVEGE